MFGRLSWYRQVAAPRKTANKVPYALGMFWRRIGHFFDSFEKRVGHVTCCCSGAQYPQVSKAMESGYSVPQSPSTAQAGQPKWIVRQVSEWN